MNKDILTSYSSRLEECLRQGCSSISNKSFVFKLMDAYLHMYDLFSSQWEPIAVGWI